MNNTKQGVHTVADPKGKGWVNTANGVVLSRHHFKENAIAKGRRVARKHGDVYTIHKDDGTVLSTQSFEVTQL